MTACFYVVHKRTWSRGRLRKLVKGVNKFGKNWAEIDRVYGFGLREGVLSAKWQQMVESDTVTVKDGRWVLSDQSMKVRYKLVDETGKHG